MPQKPETKNPKNPRKMTQSLIEHLKKHNITGGLEK